MLRLIGGVIVILLIVGPLLLQIGLLEHAPLVRQFVDLEIQAFAELVTTVRNLWNQVA